MGRRQNKEKDLGDKTKNLTLFSSSSSGPSVILEKKSYTLCSLPQTQGTAYIRHTQNDSKGRLSFAEAVKWAFVAIMQCCA